MSGRQIYQLWTEIKDIVGKASLWPRNVHRIFWTENSTHFERIIMCAFTYVNGLNPAVLLEWLCLVRICVEGDRTHQHVKRLMAYMAEGRYSRSLYSWNVARGRFKFLNGEIRIYQRR